ncbi:MAG: PHP domain-containing protein [Rhabdochlamydiaceae bacterium]|nr:PHP domain-containing protein [Rhabdochlamydiaceae bacterium]
MQNNTPWADIHTHSQASDGSFSPEDLVRHAKECGLFGLSITDHDTMAAYEKALPVAREIGIHLGIGIEFSCVFEGHDVHLLGYDFEPNSSVIQKLCLRHKNRRLHRNLAMLEMLRSKGIDIDLDNIKVHGDSVGRPHIALLMLQKGYVKSIKEAFNRYLGEGKSCYVRGESLSVDDTIDTIHKADGKAFIAHPHLLTSSFPVDLLLQKPFDGIECNYGKIKTDKPWAQIARDKRWLMSGGSDFHGSFKPDLPIGCQGVDQATFERIFQRATWA